MSKRTLAWIVIVVAGVLATAGLLWSLFGTSRLVYTEPELQARLNRELPRTVRDVTIERVAVRLAENRVALRLELRGTAVRQPVSAVVSARGVPRYRAEGGELYFDADEIKVEQLTVAGRTVAGDDDAAGAPLLVAARTAVQRLAETAIKAWLAARPAYRFKDDFKGIVVKAALVDVVIEQGALVVTFSVWSLTVTVAIFVLVLIGLLLLVYWLIRHPLWGLRVIADLADAG
jgi:hypothetical protein